MRSTTPYRSPNFVLWLAGLVLLAAAVIAHARYLRAKPATAPAPRSGPAAQEPGVYIEDFAPKHYQQGRLAWGLQLGKVHLSAGAGDVTAFDLKEGIIYDKQGLPAVRVSADKIRYDLTKRDFEVTGNVEVASVRGAVISTDRVLWTHATGVLKAPGRVAMTAPQASVTTSGLSFDTRTEVIECPREVTIRTAKSSISGRRLVYNLATESFELSGVRMSVDIEEAREKLGVRRQ